VTEINGDAPVVGSSEIEIAVPPKLAWDVLTDFQSWPSWNPAVTEVSMNGGHTEGSTFRWRAGPGTITSTIQEVDAPRRIVWSGTSFGIKAIHVHTLEGQNGGTLVRTEESYDGLVARVLHGRLKKTLTPRWKAASRHSRPRPNDGGRHPADGGPTVRRRYRPADLRS